VDLWIVEHFPQRFRCDPRSGRHWIANSAPVDRPSTRPSRQLLHAIPQVTARSAGALAALALVNATHRSASLDERADLAYFPIMVWLLVVVAVALFFAGIAVERALSQRRETRAVLNHTIDTKPAEDAAADAARKDAQHDASVVIRASSDELRSEVEQLAARGRAGK
jgi:hypothetical protein